ncbi:MAG: hypothetical protein U0324_47075 [Polyangiales bacterium]
MHDAPNIPYRRNDEPEARPPAPPTFVRAWTDAQALGGSWAVYQMLFAGLLFSLFAASVWWPLGVAGVGGVLLYLARSRARRRPVALRAEVRDSALTVTFRDQTMLQASLDAVHDIVVDRTEIQRVTYHQGVGEPLPNTQVSGGVSVGRLAATMADARVVRLTESAAHDSACMEVFGKLRVFLRAHGWRPVDER